MKLDSQYIYKAFELLDEEKIERYKYLIRDIESVDKGDLQFFVLQLWDAFQQRRKDWAYLNEAFQELNEKYNNLCDKIEYEEGWDPRAEWAE